MARIRPEGTFTYIEIRLDDIIYNAELDHRSRREDVSSSSDDSDVGALEWAASIGNPEGHGAPLRPVTLGRFGLAEP